MPVAFTSISTSPARGPSRSTSSIVNGAHPVHATAALVFMNLCPLMVGSVQIFPMRHLVAYAFHNSVGGLPRHGVDAGACGLTMRRLLLCLQLRQAVFNYRS